MQIDAILTIVVAVAGLSGFTSVGAVVTAVHKWSKAERARGREEQKKADELLRLQNRDRQ